MIRFLLGLILTALVATAHAAPVRIKDLVNIDGVRGNDLVGYGLVVGLNGTGDSFRNSPFTEQMLGTLLERLGVNVTEDAVRAKNVAAVIVTATLPPFARSGSRIDVSVSAIGDAKSLLGGTLVMTPLNAADGEIYAVAQGAVLAGGVAAAGEAASVVQGVPTAAAIPGGARIEREVAFDFSQMTSFRLALRNPDFTTATRIEAAINRNFGANLAEATDAGTINIRADVLGQPSLTRLVGRIENIQVEPQTVARVVIDQKSGTIVLGQDVRISRVAVSQGNLTLRVREAPMVSQPNPFAPGETVVVPRTQVDITQEPGIGFAEVGGETSLSAVVTGLNALGVRPRDMIDILKTIHSAGALHAELVVN
ncbi:MULTISPECIES: flagellar basal body P-ring protein FlgI [unclassified Paracoccus (in: a-proteobacteria)]|uniref:flagellar basal body P-ring protein FlgI n=1 Tax=unclassified Paracoccus (in: a-proteobacteria) TaxID=2688777 RepID=UPI0012B1CA0C|nr:MULTISPECIES: flagellar basal body P-ring protein FlgI [unclassified Paracoccus (in: a-proteobacteria)]UXU75840.1 flagellar basal body P-ring protein FlgI [Paracoccus sp. SMMA_5]UXU81749.1 flagellar basal body P-ring protein FlgI [Paracoccus sp. SMMA_5_TC]